MTDAPSGLDTYAEILDPATPQARRFNLLLGEARGVWASPKASKEAWNMAAFGVAALILLELEPGDAWEGPGRPREATWHGAWMRAWKDAGGAKHANWAMSSGGRNPNGVLRQYAEALKLLRRRLGPPPWNFHVWTSRAPYDSHYRNSSPIGWARLEGRDPAPLDITFRKKRLRFNPDWPQALLGSWAIDKATRTRGVERHRHSWGAALWRPVLGEEGQTFVPRGCQDLTSAVQAHRPKVLRSDSLERVLHGPLQVAFVMERIFGDPRRGSESDASDLAEAWAAIVPYRVYAHLSEAWRHEVRSSDWHRLARDMCPPHPGLELRTELVAGLQSRGWLVREPVTNLTAPGHTLGRGLSLWTLPPVMVFRDTDTEPPLDVMMANLKTDLTQLCSRTAVPVSELAAKLGVHPWTGLHVGLIDLPGLSRGVQTRSGGVPAHVILEDLMASAAKS
jgi:hypothetical protein